MPKGPSGQKRPADVTQNAVMVMRIATGQEEETGHKTKRAVGGKKGGKARAASLSSEQRKNIAKTAAKKRWQNKD